jgi:hypothetical protein
LRAVPRQICAAAEPPQRWNRARQALACDFSDRTFGEWSLDEWSVFAKATRLRKLFISMDGVPPGVVPAGLGPRAVTAHLAQQMPRCAVLVLARGESEDDRGEGEPPHVDHASPSVWTHEVFLPGKQPPWLADPCRRGRHEPVTIKRATSSVRTYPVHLLEPSSD